jgi:hypothetical protein
MVEVIEDRNQGFSGGVGELVHGVFLLRQDAVGAQKRGSMRLSSELRRWISIHISSQMIPFVGASSVAVPPVDTYLLT